MSQNFRESFPTEAEIQILMPGKVQKRTWTPAFAGVTERSRDTRLLYYREAI